MRLVQRLRAIRSGTEANCDVCNDPRPWQKARLLKHDAGQTSPALRHTGDFDRSA
jgi:hypothetical protein